MDKNWLIIHCAATPPSVDIDASDIRDWHVRQWPNFGRNGWAGYNEVITRSGDVQNAENGHPCSPLDRQAAHTGDCSVSGTELEDLNSNGVGVCLVGGVDGNGRPDASYTDAQWEVLKSRVVYYWNRFGLSQDRTFGHRDMIKKAQALGSRRARAKACPSFSVQAWLDKADIEAREQKGRLGFVKGLVDEVRHILSPETHTVERGDTLWAISNRYGVPLRDLIADNSIEDPNNVPIGTVLRIYQ